jgi:enoyl-CoA hydratase
MYETLRLDRHDRVAVITLIRPDQLNTMTSRMLPELDAVLDIIESDDEVRAIVITGSGRAFCAGGDINDFDPAATIEQFRASAIRCTEVLDRLQHGERPVVAAINGLAMGGGLELALACDLRVAVASAKLGVPEVRLGFLPGGGGTARLTRMLPPAIAKQLLMTGAAIPAVEAHRLGLVNEITDTAEQCLERAMGLAAEIAAMPPLAVAAAKRLVDEGAMLSLRDAVTFERETVTVLFATQDRHEGVAAFFEKRSPSFQGR